MLWCPPWLGSSRMQTGSIEGDPVRLADWAELRVLYSQGTAISWESIRTEVDVEGLLEERWEENDDDTTPDQASQSLVADAAREIQRRIDNGGKGYPFIIGRNGLELRRGINRHTPYAFCLMVSDRDYWKPGDPSARMFEDVATVALQSYLKGCAVRFGAPRDAPEREILVALQMLQERTGDPFRGTYPIKPTDKDLGLDVVGWKDFEDGEISKILVYMQCATGEDWPKKRGDLDLSQGGVWNKIMDWTTPPVKAMAIPYVVPPGGEWERMTPGLLFMDRLRIASLLPARALSIGDVDWKSWFKERYDSVL